jgi:hypothetical protein
MGEYFNPPNRIEQIGRKLQHGAFNELVEQLNYGEVLIARYDNQQGAPVAAFVEWPISYYAVPASAL